MDVGVEAGVVTREARIWSWILLIELCAAIVIAIVADNASYEMYGLVLGTLIVFAGYIVISRRAAATGRFETVGGLVRGTYVNVILLLIMNVTNSLYNSTNQPLKGAHSVQGYWDAGVPTIPVFVIPYLDLYVLLFFMQGFLAYRLMQRHLRTFALALTLSMGVAFLTFYIFQTYIPIDALDRHVYGDAPFGGIVQYINEQWYGGSFYSAFPSMHCGYAVVFAIAFYRMRKPVWSALAVANSILIIAATQFLHQHFLMDMVYGIIVAIAAYACAWFWVEYVPAARRLRRTGVTVQLAD